MTSTKENLCRRFRRLLDRIDSENRRPGDGESAAFRDVCAHLDASAFDAADALLAKVEQPNFDRDVVESNPLSTVFTTADWREQLNELVD